MPHAGQFLAKYEEEYRGRHDMLWRWLGLEQKKVMNPGIVIIITVLVNDMTDVTEK